MLLKIKEIEMGVFDKLKEPVFLKESSDAQAQLNNLNALVPLLNKEGQTLIKQDIQCLEYGIVGEMNIAYELRNSHMPMYILHDIYLESGDLTAQIDYLVFTRKLCFVIECKNLYGNIEINSAGDFIRTMEFGRYKKKEGIYSPITQNQRHMELMKKVKVDNKSNVLLKFMCEKYFDCFNKSVIVLSNPKTVLNAKYAKKEIKDKVIRADQLVKYIKDMNERSKESSRSDKELLSWAQSYLNLHIEVRKDYTEKYEKYRVNSEITGNTIHTNPLQEEVVITVAEEDRLKECEEKTSLEKPIEETAIYKELREYRLKKSREEMVKPYFIYNNNQLVDLISRMPQDKEELKKVAGFGEVKVEKYGEDIIGIVRKYVE